MFIRALNKVNNFLKNEDGVSSIEYCVIFGGIAFLIIVGGLNAVAPAIGDRLGNAFEPNAGVMPSAGTKSAGGGCKSNGWEGNCGIGFGNGGGNGTATANEGNGNGPGEDKEKDPKDLDDHPGKGPKDK